MTVIYELMKNKVLVSGACGWLCAQVLKMFFYAVMTRKLSIERLFGDGGMPSGHSATVCAMATAACMHYGVGSFEFAITAMVAIIVMHDAMGVRLETGRQAVVINQMIDLFRPISDKFDMQERLKEFVGHTPIQVAAGAVLGVVLGILINR